jgi:hypothetical protein
MNTRDAKVWQLWQRMPYGATDALWARFNAVILRKYGKPSSGGEGYRRAAVLAGAIDSKCNCENGCWICDY